MITEKFRILGLGFAVIALIGTMIIPAKAYQTGFVITEDWTYSDKSTGNYKQDTSLAAYVEWQTSNKASHNEWFQVIDANGTVVGPEVLFTYLQARFIAENSLDFTNPYYLRARREHIINPYTCVTGIWEP